MTSTPSPIIVIETDADLAAAIVEQELLTNLWRYAAPSSTRTLDRHATLIRRRSAATANVRSSTSIMLATG
jgi:hypothetical protein